MKARITLNRALLGTVVLAILVGLVPAGIVLDRRLASALEAKARVDLETAPRLLADRIRGAADAMMMHAKEFSHTPGLGEALRSRDRRTLLSVIDQGRGSLGEGVPLVIGSADTVRADSCPGQVMIDRTRAGEMPVELCTDGTAIRNVALAPVVMDGAWIGAAGVAAPMDNQQAGALSGLTRSGVVVVSAMNDSIVATTLDSVTSRVIARAGARSATAGVSHEVLVSGERFLVVSAPLANAGRALFVRSMREELAVLPELRRTAALSALAALALAISLGAWGSSRVARPVRQLASAARAFRDESTHVLLPESRIAEVADVSERFADMRSALATRLNELRETAGALQDRNARLTALQSDLMQRERLAATGRLVTQLAHEIRNPVANLRNCLEVVRRRVETDVEAREFVDLAIDELLRMHELAEQMLDVNRPRDATVRSCRPARIAREVARLAVAGIPRDTLDLEVIGDAAIEAGIPPDALKQVLLNLIQNAREAAAAARDALGGPHGVVVRIMVEALELGVRVEVADNGPGIAPELRGRVFDPFFSSKAAVHGVGLGLFVAEGLVRGVGGTLLVGDSTLGGASFVIDLPPMARSAADLTPVAGVEESR